tara:strand:- start:1732 stop:1956 length:225 start_codon:yes stop_codon:yes gene_type:complete
MKIDPQTEFVLSNMVQAWACDECNTTWIHFKDGSNDGFYRLTENPKILCPKCSQIDLTIEQHTIMTAERWTNEN